MGDDMQSWGQKTTMALGAGLVAALMSSAVFADGERYQARSGGGGAAGSSSYESDAGYSSWAGLYIGMSVGARLNEIDWKTTSLKFDDGTTPATFPSGPVDRNYDTTGLQFGGFGGYNVQTAGIVLGVDASISGGGDSNSRTRQEIPGASNIFGSLAPNTFDSVKVSSGFGAALRGRVGMLLRPETMLFLAGGVAFQQFGFHVECQGSPLLTNASVCAQINKPSETVSQTGWTIGAGVEQRLAGGWFARFEYAYANFGSADLTFKLPDNTGVTSIGTTLTARTEMDIHTATVGVGYKF